MLYIYIQPTAKILLSRTYINIYIYIFTIKALFIRFGYSAFLSKFAFYATGYEIIATSKSNIVLPPK